ncbi:SurA N-terminal domain-containing protein [Sporosarcina pasteurii]|uniref:peptidylprolyl isomerase n=1 Tax=Sporosarcina pasteurii TaxID=1474 RepID=A0A380C2A3_SPOPA|nr:SurA N-terminal domain-containing protein [Sporosarcina pasteurii]MDS9471610.1 SurA N-terminal domain-containing protein [Sporosarcina pasteurii]QBQ04780.1 hypothetical protein E2C16_03420 [Sporosarcina pasteurii]SUJ11329.1 peptidylprolyl isomerase [Sporosarcina pasteurii]
MNLKKIFLSFFAGALALSLAACNGDEKAQKEEVSEEQVNVEEIQAKLAEQQVDKNDIVAVVNDEEINGEQYNAVLMSIQTQMQQSGQDPSSEEAAEQIKDQTLDTLVNQTLLLQQAKIEEIKASQDEIEEEYKAFVQQFGDEKTLIEALKQENMDTENLKEQISESIIFRKYQEQVTPIEEVSDETVKEYYEQIAAQTEDGEQELPPLEELSENIKQIIQQEEQQKKLSAHLETLKEDAKIELKI